MSNRVPFDNPRLNALALPTALGISALAKLLVLPGILLSATLTVFVHELGHAVAAWMGSRFAMPIAFPAFGVTFTGAEPSMLVLAAVLGVLLYGAYRCLVTNHVAWMNTLIALAAVVVFLTFAVPARTNQLLIVFSGNGGQFALSAAMIVAFFHPLPDRLRWDFFRFLPLAIGAFALVDTTWHWIGIWQGTASLPWGSVMDGRDSPTGDLQRLMDPFGWTQAQIKARYTILGVASWIVVLVQYAWTLVSPPRVTASPS